MDREIKFRIWNGEEIHDVEMLDLIGDMASLYRTLKNEFIPYGNNERGKLMQYTGLKDKNGKEIYFNDIVKFKFENENVFYKGTATVVETMTGGAGILYDYSDINNKEVWAVIKGGVIEDIWQDDDLWTFEVIGNIHEHPQLLTKNHD